MLIAISTGFGIQNEIKSKFSNLFGDASISQYGSEFFNTSKALKVISSKFPIGVETIYKLFLGSFIIWKINLYYFFVY